MYVLIVDDEGMTRAALKLILEGAGHRTCEAFNGEAALRQAELERPDLVLLDLHLGPGIDGFEVARRLPREMNVVIVTGDPAVDVRRAAEDAYRAITGRLVIVEKPVDAAELLRVVSASERP